MSRQRGVTTVLTVLAASALVAGCATTIGPRDPSGEATGTTSGDYRRAYDIGLEAYLYGLPLLVTDATFRTMTSVDVSQGAYGPVNQFNNVRSANTASSTAVVAPGATSLSSIAWLDLTDGPLVMHVPQVTGRSFVLALLNPYTENLVNLGTASSTPPGDYVITDPSQRATTIPAGTTRIDVDQSRIWVIGSTQLKGASDVAAVNAVQDQYTLVPLSAYGTAWTPPVPSSPRTTVTQYAPATGIEFFDQLGQQLAQFPPPAADAPALARFAAVGIGPGLTPSTDDALSDETQRGLADAAAAGPDHVTKGAELLFAADFDRHAGYLLGGFGRYGTDYARRAVISQIGLGAFVPHQAIYAMTWSDGSRAALAGSSAYTLHLATAPPTSEGWSFTVYTVKGGLVSSPSGRSALTNTSPLTRNADGSIDLYLQAAQPSDPAKAANWLPTPEGEDFQVTWRLFAPTPDAIPAVLDGTGWQPPVIASSAPLD